MSSQLESTNSTEHSLHAAFIEDVAVMIPEESLEFLHHEKEDWMQARLDACPLTRLQNKCYSQEATKQNDQ